MARLSASPLIQAPRPPHGWLHRRLAGKMLPLVIYNRRGRVVLWAGTGVLPVNGPALWFTVICCAVGGFVGAQL